MTIKIESLELLVIVVIITVCGQTTRGSETRQCPAYCTCDLFENLNRADCSGQRLITPNVEVPSAVELLDISYNDITTLDNTCFEGLIYVVNLTIVHNALHTVYLDAFGPLQDVKSIDLSYNRLEYFDERIFETNTKLTRLDLSGNKFMSLQNKPFLRSATIRYLGLQDAQVTYIYPLMFTEMPALRDVDVSNNLMITLSSTPFNTLHQLEAVNLEENRWICDKTLEDTLQFLKNHGVETKLSSCAMFERAKARSMGAHMFERMMEAPASEIAPPKESTSIDHIWRPKKPIDLERDEELSCEKQTPIKVCRLYRNCLANNRILTEQKADPHCQYTLNDLHFVFLTGISLGIAVITCMVTCWICIKRCWATQKKISQRRAERRTANVATARRPIPPPVPPRQRRSNRRSANPPPLNRSLSSPVRRGGSPPDGNQSDFATFVSRFFERPSRHQYYRTINENAGRMIRRLSQSNLLGNRLSQHFSGARNGDNENGQHTEPLIYTQAIGEQPVSRLAQIHLSSPGGFRTIPSLAFARYEETLTQPDIPPSVRPETPPPSYVDVMKPKVDV